MRAYLPLLLVAFLYVGVAGESSPPAPQTPAVLPVVQSHRQHDPDGSNAGHSRDWRPASLAAAGGTAARWLSLNDSVATVDASGTVTGRAAGNTPIVALNSASDGSLRVMAIPVAVKP